MATSCRLAAWRTGGIPFSPRLLARLFPPSASFIAPSASVSSTASRLYNGDAKASGTASATKPLPHSEDNDDCFDVAIVGGGPVGLSIACGLLADDAATVKGDGNKLRVLLLEAGRFPPTPLSDDKAPGAVGGESFSSRAVALSSGSVSLLRRLGAWDDASRLVRERVAPIRRMRVAESDSDAVLTFQSPSEDEQLAYVAELAPIVGRLAERAAAAGARLIEGARLTGFASANAFSEPRLRLRLAGGSRPVSTRLLIGCDGFASPVRRLAGIGAVDIPYVGHKALAATLIIEGANGLDGEAFQRFLPDGPLALLPLPGRHASLVWCDRTDRIARLADLAEPEFLAEINSCLATGGGPVAPRVSAVQAGSRLAFPLGFMHANRYAQGRVALAGDAAHRLSPLAGQGMNLGMSDAECLIRIVREAASNGADPSDPTYLLDYETERQRQVVPVALVNEALGMLYSLPPDSWLAAPLRLARTAGFRLTNRCDPVKDFLTLSATSGRIQLPQLPSVLLESSSILQAFKVKTSC